MEQVPNVNLRGLVVWLIRLQRDLPRLPPDSKELLRTEAVATADAAAANVPHLRVLRADLPFYLDDDSVRYAAGRTFFYADDNHLDDQGAEQVRVLFKTAIAEAHSGLPST